jgi:hypothetical protein
MDLSKLCSLRRSLPFLCGAFHPLAGRTPSDLSSKRTPVSRYPGIHLRRYSATLFAMNPEMEKDVLPWLKLAEDLRLLQLDIDVSTPCHHILYCILYCRGGQAATYSILVNGGEQAAARLAPPLYTTANGSSGYGLRPFTTLSLTSPCLPCTNRYHSLPCPLFAISYSCPALPCHALSCSSIPFSNNRGGDQIIGRRAK